MANRKLEKPGSSVLKNDADFGSSLCSVIKATSTLYLLINAESGKAEDMIPRTFQHIKLIDINNKQILMKSIVLQHG